MRHIAFILGIAGTLWTLSVSPLAAQGVVVPPRPVDPAADFRLADDASAYQIRVAFERVMSRYPTTLRELLRLDPVLMSDPAFMSNYPALADFIGQYPEVVHNPSFFVGRPNSSYNETAENVAIVTVLVSIVLAVGWLIKTFVDYRRWSRLSHVQAEAHAKLLDRFTASQDLLAYLETPAGRRFLESTPIQVAGASVPGSPVNRILLSTQAGVVLAAGGVGLYVAIPRLADQAAADPLFVVAVLAISLGIGFVVSAGTAFLLSQRLGAIEGRHQRED